jgi:RNA polymerase sigma factor (sigma-70 family)
MAEAQLRSLLRHLHRRAGGPWAGLNDGQLLERFLRHRDEAAFEVLVWRHGPMVLGVCRRVLRREHDAEDAFQATFLALARKARSMNKRESVAAWLYKVGYRVSLAANTRAARERSCPDLAAVEARPEAGDAELRRLLDEEVNRLPDRYRVPFVLCCVEGRTIAEAARELGCPCGTVGTRLARARQRLRTRLARRGFGLSAGLLAAPLAIPHALAGATARAAAALAAGKAGVVAAPVAVLTEGVLRAMLMSKVKMAAVLLVVALAGTGTGMMSYRVTAAEAPAAQPSAEDRAAAVERELRAAREELDHVQARLDKARAALHPDSNEEPAVAAPGQQPAAWAEKMFQGTLTHDFGSVPRGAQLFHRFTITNIYAVRMEITGVRSSCGCVSATAAQRVLKPHESTTIEVKMDSTRFTGPKTVRIRVSVGPDFVSSAELKVCATSRADLALNPGRLDFGIVPRGEMATRAIDVEYTGPLDWRVTPIAGDGAPLEVKLEESYRRPGQVGYRVRARLKADAPPGALPQEVRLSTNDPITPILSVPVVGKVQEPLVTAPHGVVINLRVGQTASRKVVMRGSKPFRIVAVDGLGEELGAEWAAEAAPLQIIQLRYKAARVGQWKGELRVRTDLGGSAEASITVEATVGP